MEFSNLVLHYMQVCKLCDGKYDTPILKQIASMYNPNIDNFFDIIMANITMHPNAATIKYNMLAEFCKLQNEIVSYNNRELHYALVLPGVHQVMEPAIINNFHYYDVTMFDKLQCCFTDNWEVIRDDAINAVRCGPIIGTNRSKGQWSGTLDPHYMELTGWVHAWDNNDDTNIMWLNYGLMYNNLLFDTNALLCAEVSKLLLHYVAIGGHINMAGFSLMRPKSKIEPHVDSTGYSTSSLAYHLGLIVPDECELVVDNYIEYEADGKAIIFDSNHEHWAKNASEADRIILYIDFKKN